MSNMHRLHPVAYLITVVDVFKNYWYIFLITFFNLLTGKLDYRFLSENIFALILLIFSIFLIIAGIIKDWTIRYWIESDKVIYKSGLFVKKERELSIERIQSIDITQPIIARIFNAAVVDIKSPGESITLPGVKYDMAESIRTYLYKQKEDEVPAHTETSELDEGAEEKVEEAISEGQVIFQISPKEMLLLIATSGGLGIFLAALFGGLSYIGLDKVIVNVVETMQGIVGHFIVPIIVAFVIVLLFVGVIIGGIIMYVRYYGYKITKHNDDFIIQYGLLERKTITVNKNRIQNISVEEGGLISRLLKIHSLNVGITSNDFNLEDSGDVILTPVIKQKDSYEFLNTYFSEYNITRPEPNVPLRSYRRYFQVTLAILFIIFSAVCSLLYYKDYMIPFYIVLAIGILLCVLTVISGIYSAKNSGTLIDNGDLNMLTTSSFIRKHYIIKRSKIIDTSIMQTFFTHRAGLGTIDVKTAAGFTPKVVEVKHLEIEEANEIFDYVKRGVADGESI